MARSETSTETKVRYGHIARATAQESEEHKQKRGEGSAEDSPPRILVLLGEEDTASREKVAGKLEGGGCNRGKDEKKNKQHSKKMTGVGENTPERREKQ